MKQLLTILFLIPFIGFGQNISPTQYFDSTYEISGENMVAGFDSSIIVSGAIYDFPPKLYVHKIDMDGNLLAEKTIEAYSAEEYFPGKLIQTKDSAYITINTLIQSSFNKVIVTKWDQNLDTIWQKIYGFGADVKIGGIVQSFDSSTYISLSDNQNIILSKLDYNGDMIWTKSLDYQDGVDFSDICETSDSNICIVSTTLYSSSFISILDTSGNELLSKEIFDYSCKEILCDKNGELYILGITIVSQLTGIIKLDDSLNLISVKQFYFPGIVNSDFKFLNDTTLIASGSSISEHFSGALYLINTDLDSIENVNFNGEFKALCEKNGEPYFIEQGPILLVKAPVQLRHYTISAFHDDSLACNEYYQYGMQTANANLLNTFVTISNSTSQEIAIQLPIGNANFGKDNSCISIFGSLDEIDLPKLSIYPNPSYGEFSIKTEDGKIIESIEIYSAEGRLIYTNENIKNSKAQINLNTIPTGIYYIRALIGSEFIFDKIVIK